jgi:hypothetical protein
MKASSWKKALWLVAVIFLLGGSAPGGGEAGDNPKIFTDTHGYFSFTPPPGWVEKDYPGETVGRVRFIAPDKLATFSIIVMPAPPQEATYDKLLAAKRGILEKMRREKPEGRYSLAESTICGFKCAKFGVEIPGQLVQENYVLVEKGFSVNFGYAAVNQTGLEKYRRTALDSLCTIKLKK